MKNTLNNIFDKAKSSEIENLINKSPVPEISADTLCSIKSKVYNKTGIEKAKKKSLIVIHWRPFAAIIVCLVLIVGIVFCSPAITKIFTKNNQPNGIINTPSSQMDSSSNESSSNKEIESEYFILIDPIESSQNASHNETSSTSTETSIPSSQTTEITSSQTTDTPSRTPSKADTSSKTPSKADTPVGTNSNNNYEAPLEPSDEVDYPSIEALKSHYKSLDKDSDELAKYTSIAKKIVTDKKMPVVRSSYEMELLWTSGSSSIIYRFILPERKNEVLFVQIRPLRDDEKTAGNIYNYWENVRKLEYGKEYKYELDGSEETYTISKCKISLGSTEYDAVHLHDIGGVAPGRDYHIYFEGYYVNFIFRGQNVAVEGLTDILKKYTLTLETL